MRIGSSAQSRTDRLALIWVEPEQAEGIGEPGVEDPEPPEERRGGGVHKGDPAPAHQADEDDDRRGQLDREQGQRRELGDGVLRHDRAGPPRRGRQDQGDARTVPATTQSPIGRVRAGQQQPPLPQPQPSAPARASRSRAAGPASPAGRSVAIASSGRVALMIAPCSPSATAWVGSIVTSTRPTAARPARYSRERQGAGDAAAERAAFGALVGAERVVGDDVAHADPAAGPQDAGDLGEDGGLVGREVDHAVADDDIDRAAGSGIDSIVPRTNSTLSTPASAALRPGELEHLVGHVEPDRPPGRADPAGREDHVDPAAGAEVEDALAGSELGDGGRVAAAEAGEDRGLRAAGPAPRRRTGSRRRPRSRPGRSTMPGRPSPSDGRSAATAASA